MHWMVKVLIGVVIIAVVIAAFSFVELTGKATDEQDRQARAAEAARQKAENCREYRIECYAYCDTKFIDHFCNKECEENYRVCME